MLNETFARWQRQIRGSDLVRIKGIVEEVAGLTCVCAGPHVPVGTLCEVRLESGSLPLEVVGFRRDKVLLMPLGRLNGIAPGATVESSGRPLMIPVGDELLGRVLGALGEPLDNKGPLRAQAQVPVHGTSPAPLDRERIREPLPLGIRVIDSCLTVGQGQRVGIFSGAGLGKSVLLGSIARHAQSTINVIALVGERGREVREFIERDLGEEGLKRSAVVVSTSDEPALVRIKAALTATRIAEYFRDQGHHVLLCMDSITRLCFAQREVGLSIGEPPATKGYPPSVYAMLPELLERTGTSNRGSITGLYTILVEADDLGDPVADQTRSILDGHIVLSRKLAARGHYPAVDVLQSISRVMPDVTVPIHRQIAQLVRETLSTYEEVEDLFLVGAYKAGGNPQVDRSLALVPKLYNFFRQSPEEKTTLEEGLQQLGKILSA